MTVWAVFTLSIFNFYAYDGKMVLLQYFKSVDGQYPGSKLQDPQGDLSQVVPSRAISVANNHVATLQQSADAKVRGRYLKTVPRKPKYES